MDLYAQLITQSTSHKLILPIMVTFRNIPDEFLAELGICAAINRLLLRKNVWKTKKV